MVIILCDFLKNLSLSLSYEHILLCFSMQIPRLLDYYSQNCILSPCLFSLYAEYIMGNAGPEETQAGIKISGRNINYLSYADDATLMAESEEELKSLLMKVEEESEKVGLKLHIQKTIMASGPITSWEIDGETVETVSDFTFWGLQNHCRW